ncbi:hypothetical protein F2Q70_00040709 [Brassica cretica]|uniref:Uncharacterized protein n=1 Tax=Brassica cretica TaxID=69181 RepID=A0A8S9K3U9_BRACR|nr:hypothetical protein F2Q70_00040709 [Brassica cretica]
MAKETSRSTGRHRRLYSSTTSTLDCDSPRCDSVSLLGSNYQSEKNVCENPYVASDFSFTPLPRQSNDSVLCLDNIRSVQLFSPTNDIDLTPIVVSQYAMDRHDHSTPLMFPRPHRQSNDSVLCLDNIRSVQLFSPTNDIDLTPIVVSQYAMDSFRPGFK